MIFQMSMTILKVWKLIECTTYIYTMPAHIQYIYTGMYVGMYLGISLTLDSPHNVFLSEEQEFLMLTF